MKVHADWLLTPEGAAIHLPSATAVIADLHLGYADVRRRGGEAVPVAGLDEVVAQLNAVVVRCGVRRLVVAGDLFEDGRWKTTLKELGAWLQSRGVELCVVPGNHDRGFPHGAEQVPVFPDGLDVAGWRVVHGDRELPSGKVVTGHWHPCLRWGGLAAPCYLVQDRQIVLPAFSPDAAGGNVLGSSRWREFRCAVIVGTRVLDFGPVAALKQRLQNEPAARARVGNPLLRAAGRSASRRGRLTNT